LQVSNRDELARRLVSDVEDDTGCKAPFQRHLVDGAGRLALGYLAVVIGGIDMSTGVRYRLQLLDRPAQTVGVDEILALHTEELLPLLEALTVVASMLDVVRRPA